MKKIIILLVALVLVTGVYGLTKAQYLGIDFDNVSMNVNRVGVVYNYDSDLDVYDVRYVIQHDMVRRVSDDYFEVYTGELSYNIDLDEFILCVEDTNLTDCKDRLKDRMRTYFVNKLENKRVVLGQEQDKVRASLTKGQAISEILGLDVGEI